MFSSIILAFKKKQRWNDCNIELLLLSNIQRVSITIIHISYSIILILLYSIILYYIIWNRVIYHSTSNNNMHGKYSLYHFRYMFTTSMYVVNILLSLLLSPSVIDLFTLFSCFTGVLYFYLNTVVRFTSAKIVSFFCFYFYFVNGFYNGRYYSCSIVRKFLCCTDSAL